MHSLNQILTGLNRIADAHLQINSFGFGDLHEFTTSGDTKYPAMFVHLEDAKRARATTTYNLMIYLFDKPRMGELDEQEILSDLHRIAEDVYSELHNSEWTWHFRLDEATFNSDTEQSLDNLTGVWFLAPIILPNEGDRCQIPTNTITHF